MLALDTSIVLIVEATLRPCPLGNSFLLRLPLTWGPSQRVRRLGALAFDLPGVVRDGVALGKSSLRG